MLPTQTFGCKAGHGLQERTSHDSPIKTDSAESEIPPAKQLSASCYQVVIIARESSRMVVPKIIDQ